MGQEPIFNNLQQQSEIFDPSEYSEEELLDMIHEDIDKRLDAVQLSTKYRIAHDVAIKLSIKRHYEKGRGSIQDLARVYHVDVDSVLRTIGIDDMSEVTVVGDLIDREEAGPEAELNPNGKRYKVPYDLE